MNIITRSLVDLNAKEQGEETIYIRRQEAARKKALEEKMTEILQRHHEDEEQQALLKLLQEKKEEKIDQSQIGIFQYLGFDDWRWAFPIASLFVFPMITLDVIYVDYKMYLVSAFALMWHAFGKILSPIYNEKTNWVGESIRNSWIEFDNDDARQINDDIKVTENFLQAKEVFQEIFDSVDEIAQAQAHALNLENQNEFHRDIQRKLDSLAALNASASRLIKTDMIETIKEDVLEMVTTDADVKDMALEWAIVSLSTGTKETDIVSELYVSALEQYRENLQYEDHAAHAIADQLESQIEAILQPPEKIVAGNVYETHPVL